MTKLAEWLTQERMTQREFADRVGTTQPVINRFVRGRVAPGRRLAVAIEKETRGQVSVASWED